MYIRFAQIRTHFIYTLLPTSKAISPLSNFFFLVSFCTIDECVQYETAGEISYGY